MKSSRNLVLTTLVSLVALSGGLRSATAQAPAASGQKPKDESVLGEFIVTGVTEEHIPKIAILPSLSPDYEDVIVRSVIRRDLEISGMFKLISDQDAPTGAYGFNDPVNVKAWQAKGAEAIVKVAARKAPGDQIEVIGIAYFPSAGPEPVYETKLTVSKDLARQTAHRITDDLLGALTGRPGGFSSRFTFSGAWGRNRRIFTVDADGYGLSARSDIKATSIAPAFGPQGDLFYVQSKTWSPFQLFRLKSGEADGARFEIPYKRSLYGVAFNKGRTRMALAVSEPEGSAIYVGDPDGKNMKRASVTEVAIHPVFSPSGKLAWIGGSAEQGGQRVYLEGKAISPSGFSAYAPTFCDTEDGIMLVYAVTVGQKQDLVMSNEKGQGMSRLTQNQGTNAYPACSPDGRLLAFFSDRKGESGLYVMSLKRWTTTKVLGTVGETLRWDPIPEAPRTVVTKPASATTAAATPSPVAAVPAAPATPTPTPAKPASNPAPATPVTPASNPSTPVTPATTPVVPAKKWAL